MRGRGRFGMIGVRKFSLGVRDDDDCYAAEGGDAECA
jgi:hypothetical protein